MIEGNRLMAFVPVSNADAARRFYRDTLGLRLTSEDGFALAFDVEGVMLRATVIPKFTPQPFTVLGWQVADAHAMAKQMAAGGVALERFSGMNQDEDGLWHAPGGALVGWFKDPDGNILSITQLP
ncbi:MAG TPA: VOC family protein [Acidobacteriaceae bacterium]|nr:VOC family protein [Acidobacteriaceae bacterium]